MNILVTGGSGNVGKGVVAHLARSGHSVRVVDWKIRDPYPGVEYAECDITNFTQLREQVKGMEAVVHLAAYAYPGAAPGAEIFRVNCTGTYNIFEASAVEGIRRVALASSINALGFNFGVKSFPIRYFPIDEAHPTFTTDPYSFSKEATESIARYYWRRDGISSVCLRMPYIYSMENQFDQWAAQFIQRYRVYFQELQNLPYEEQRNRLSGMYAGLEKQRVEREWEKPWTFGEEDWDEEAFFNDPAVMAHFGYTDFWSILSVEDTALAFEKAVLASFEGSHPLYVTERENSVGVESEALLRMYFPEVTDRTSAIAGKQSLVSYAAAKAVIGFEPQRSICAHL